jgi:hypothetical protein
MNFSYFNMRFLTFLLIGRRAAVPFVPNIIRQIKLRIMRWAGLVARMGEERKVYRVLVGKPEGKRPFG